MTDLRDADSADSDESGISASDALLDALGAGVSVEDDRACTLLSALVSDVSADRLPGLPDVARRRRTRRLAPRTGIAAGAVLAVLSTGGAAAASVNAGPTSPLFPLHRALTGQSQLDNSQRQALEIKDKLASATKALAAGKVERAQKDVASAGGRLPKVAATDGHRALADQWTALDRQVRAQVTSAPTTAAPGTSTASPTPTHSPTPGRPTATPGPTQQTGQSTTPALTTSPVSPVTGGAPATGVTSPTPSPTPSVPSGTLTTSPSPSGPTATGSASPTPTTPSPSGKHHVPGAGQTGVSVAPAAPPAPSYAPPSSAPVTVPPATSLAPSPSSPAPSPSPSPSPS